MQARPVSWKDPLKPSFSATQSPEHPFEIFQRFLEIIKQDLESKFQNPEIQSELSSVLEKYSADLSEFSVSRLSERLVSCKTTSASLEKVMKTTEKKLAAFQKEARKSSAERKFEIRDIKPVRSSVNRSVSPGEKKNITQENSDLKDQLKKVQEERDVLRIWKENVLKLPGNFSDDANSMFKELETCKKQLMIGNKVLGMKIQAMATAIFKFIKDTGPSQKTSREKEGFASWNFYETEKSKLEVKIKELAELKDLTQSDSSFARPTSSFDFSQFSEKIVTFENENKTLKNQLREAKKSVKGLEIKCAELENMRWQTEREKSILERKSRNSTTPTGNKKHLIVLSKQFESIKTWAETRINDLNTIFENRFDELSKKLTEKEVSLAELKNRFTENLKENLNLLIAMNENVKNSNFDKTSDEILKSQIENFEFIIEQHKTYHEIKVKELNETIDSLEKERNCFVKQAKSLEHENFAMKLEINRLKDLEISWSNSKILISELEEINKSLNNRLRIAKQKELEFDQLLYEKTVMNKEIFKLSEELCQKEKMIMELQQTLSFEQMQTNTCLEDLLFKEKTVKSELEMAKIELNNYKNELRAIEKSNQDLEEKLASLRKNGSCDRSN